MTNLTALEEILLDWDEQEEREEEEDRELESFRTFVRGE